MSQGNTILVFTIIIQIKQIAQPKASTIFVNGAGFTAKFSKINISHSVIVYRKSPFGVHGMCGGKGFAPEKGVV